jgi:hypothetical protein
VGPEYGDPIDEGALAIEGPDAAEPVGICGSVGCDVEPEGGVAGIEEKLEDFCISEDSANWGWASKYD